MSDLLHIYYSNQEHYLYIADDFEYEEK